MKEEVKYFLALECLPGDYNIVEINKLDICDKFYSNDLAGIDLFTLSFTEEEIRASIERSNTVQNKYLEGNLRILSNKGHNLRCLFKNNLDDVHKFQFNNDELDNDSRNKLFGKYKKILETTFTDKDFIDTMLNRFKASIRENDKKEMFKIIEELFTSNVPYNKVREEYFVISDYMAEKKNYDTKKLEKIDN